MNRDELIALAERVEAASGPSYELDCAIWDAIYPGERRARFDALTAKGQPYHRRLGAADMDGYVKPMRAFTASLDAAMTLVPEGWAWSVGFDEKGNRAITGPMRSFETQIGRAATPALALTAAALRALAGAEQ